MALKIAGFDKVNETERMRRMVMSVEGPEKTGKSTLIYSAPGPIGLINMDEGDEGVIEKWVKDKDIYRKNFDLRTESNQKGWTALWEDCKKSYINLLANPAIRTIGMDTGTEMWELIRLARFGGLTSPGGNVKLWYGPINKEFSDWLRLVYKTDKNMIITHKVKDQYVNDKRTGKNERDGYKHIPYVVQVNVVTWRRAEEAEATASLTGIPVRGTFGMTIRDCRQNADVAGEELEGEMSNFAFLASTVFPESEVEDWL